LDRSGRVGLVTGANRGIGFEIARQLAKLGYQVIAGSRDNESGRKAAEKIGSENVRSTQLELQLCLLPLEVSFCLLYCISSDIAML
jgi:NAD(P)-dependent dehydrogenase (short-subunit alcohol dehydrogenase family)